MATVKQHIYNKNNNTYVHNINPSNYTIKKIESKVSDAVGIDLSFTNAGVTFNSPLNLSKVYYCEIMVGNGLKVSNASGSNDSIILDKADAIISFKIQLEHRLNEDSSIQNIKNTFFNTNGSSNITSSSQKFIFIFQPVEDFDGIIFSLDRATVLAALTEINSNGNEEINSLNSLNNYLNSYLNIESFKIYEIDNILSQENQDQVVTHLGVQAAEGFLFSLNGAEIRVGQSEIYEFQSQDCPITFIGMPIVNDSSLNNFILDYKLEPSNIIDFN